MNQQTTTVNNNHSIGNNSSKISSFTAKLCRIPALSMCCLLAAKLRLSFSDLLLGPSAQLRLPVRTLLLVRLFFFFRGFVWRQMFSLIFNLSPVSCLPVRLSRIDMAEHTHIFIDMFYEPIVSIHAQSSSQT